MSSFVSGARDIVTQGAQSALAALAGNTLRPDDSLFVESSVYFFELRLPNSSNPTSITRYRFPLALNPEAIAFSEPFSAETTPTLGGGLVVEESGIVTRNLRIRGSTGSYQRQFMGDISQLNTLNSDQRTFGRVLDPVIQGILSGQKIFQYMQDSVFRVYADAKRDPNLAAGTALIFHMPRESEAWEVVPMHFGSDRSAGRPLEYPFDIELLVVQKAELTLLPFSEDRPILDALKDPFKVAANFIARATAAVQALTAAQGQLRNYFRQLDVVLVQANSLISSVSLFVQGSANLISTPASTVRVLASTIASSLESFVAARDSISAVPQTYEQSLRQLEGSLYYLMLHPESFAQARAAAAQAEQATVAYLNAQAAATLAANAAIALPTTLQAASKLGTSLTQEQAVQIQTDVQAGGSTIAYTGSHSYQVRAGDTFSNLAGRFLGDARQWRYIAALNNITPPYSQLVGSTPLLAQGQPVTINGLSLGDSILIPDFSTPQSSQTDQTTLGVSPDAPVQDRLFGTDLALAVGGGVATNTRTLADGQKLDWVIDQSSGSVDLKKASGLDNLAQAILTRVSLERGEDPLYQSLGVDPIVGSNIAEIDAQTLAFNLREALTQDPRIAQVISLNVQRSAAGDGLLLVGSLQARGFSEPVPVTLPLSGAQTG